MPATVKLVQQGHSARDELRHQRRALSKEHLLRAAENVFAQNGYEDAPMAEIAKVSGLALATVYTLGDSKEAIYAEIFRKRGTELMQHVLQEQKDPSTPLQMILGGIRGYVGYLCAHPTYLQILLREQQPWALTPKFHTTEQERQWHTGVEMVTALFRQAIQTGELLEEEPELMARLMISTHQIYLTRWVEQGMTEPPERLVQRMQEHVLRAFGVSRQPLERTKGA